MNARIPLTLFIASSIFLTGCDNDSDDEINGTVNNVQAVSNVQVYKEHTKVKVLQINDANNIELLVKDKPVTIVNPFIEVPHVNITGYEDHPLGEKTLDYVQQLLQSAKFLTIDYFHEEQHSETGERYGFLKVEHADLGELLLKQGLAKTVHRYYDNEDFHRYRALEQDSKEEEKGIWVFPNTFDEDGFIKIPTHSNYQNKSSDGLGENSKEEKEDTIHSPREEYQSQILKR